MLRVILLALVLSAGLASAENAVVVRYVGGVAAELTFEPVFRDGRVGGGCAGATTVLVHAGGACNLPVGEGSYVVSVVDDVAGPMAFSWSTANAQNGPCSEGQGTSGDLIVVPAGCVRISVFLNAGATTGEIVITRV